MSTENSSVDATNGSPKAHRLAEFLRREAGDGEIYVKAKFIADDVGLSPKEIGARMTQLQGSLPDLSIEKWSYTGATTWRIAAE